jgi:opacity protein-like surface antigen
MRCKIIFVKKELIMKRFILVGFSVFLLFILQNVLAVAVQCPQCSFASKFTGVYLGGTVGGALYKYQVTDIDGRWNFSTLTFKQASPFVGIHAGYNVKVSNSWLVGVKANYNIINAVINERYDLDTWVYSKLRSAGSILGVLGAEMNDSTLLYVDSGVGFLRTHGSWIEDNDPSDSWPNLNNKNIQAWVVGLGMRFATNSGWYVDAGVDCYTPEGLTPINQGGYRMIVRNSLVLPRLEVGYTFKRIMGHNVLAAAFQCPKYSSAARFTGVYLGGTVGGAFYKYQLTDIDMDWHGATLTFKQASPFVGIHGGYNVKISHSWLVGVKANYNVINAVIHERYDQLVWIYGKLHSAGSLLGVLGSKINDSTLLYVDSGVGFLRTHNNTQALVVGLGMRFATDSGWYVDAGVDCYTPERFTRVNQDGYRMIVRNRLVLPRLEVGYTFKKIGNWVV